MKYWKMNANGTDYLILNNRPDTLPEPLLPALARELCQPHQLAGSGCLVVDHAQGEGELRVLAFDREGAPVPLTPGAAACVCRYAFETGLCGFQPLLESREGLVLGQRLGPQQYTVTVEDQTSSPIVTALVAKGETCDEDLPELYWMLSDALCAS